MHRIAKAEIDGSVRTERGTFVFVEEIHGDWEVGDFIMVTERRTGRWGGAEIYAADHNCAYLSLTWDKLSRPFREVQEEIYQWMRERGDV